MNEVKARLERQQVEISDPKAIRALAHAARLTVLSELYASQASQTATELATITGLTPSAMSYHLRALQKWGMVVPAESDGDARERRWKAAGTHFTIKSTTGDDHPEQAILALEFDAQRRRISDFSRERDALKTADPEAEIFPSAMFASLLMYLDRDRAAEMIERVNAVFSEYEGPQPRRDQDGIRRVAAMYSIVPDSGPHS